MCRGFATRVACLEEELRRTTETLRALASCVEWEDDTKPIIDTVGLKEAWSRVERTLEHFDRNEPLHTPETDGLARVFALTQERLRTVHGLDLAGPVTELDRACWTRELSVDVLASIGQLFDRVADVCLSSDDVARWRRRKATDALLRALQLAQLHGVDEAILLRELEPEVPAVCGVCSGRGRVVVEGYWLGEPNVERPCSECSQ